MYILEEGDKELEQVNDVSQSLGVHKLKATQPTNFKDFPISPTSVGLPRAEFPSAMRHFGIGTSSSPSKFELRASVAVSPIAQTPVILAFARIRFVINLYIRRSHKEAQASHVYNLTARYVHPTPSS
jgi:hypothetical protein